MRLRIRVGLLVALAWTAASAAPPPPEYKDPNWFEDAPGHKQALELQSRHGVPLLIFFYADWNDECTFLWKELLGTGDFKSAAKGLIKLRINPEHGKPEGQLANKYRLRRYPTTIVILQPRQEPRNVDLIFRSFGKLRVPKPDAAVLDILGAPEPGGSWRRGGGAAVQ